MSKLEEIFEGSENWGGEAPEAQAPVVTPDEGKKAKKSEDDKVKAAAEQVLKSNPGLLDTLSTKADDFEVTKIFSTYLIPNIKPDKSQPKGENGKYPIIPTSYKVGYEVRNVGAEPVQYKAPNYVLNPETGKYENQEYDAVINPGETAILDRLHMTMLFARPEYSFSLRNGSIKKSSKQGIQTQEEMLRSYYFAFDREAVSFVSDDDVNQIIDEDGADGTKKISDEYTKYFGFVMNKEAKPARKSKASSRRAVSNQERQALLIMSMLQKGDAQ